MIGGGFIRATPFFKCETDGRGLSRQVTELPSFTCRSPGRLSRASASIKGLSEDPLSHIKRTNKDAKAPGVRA